MAVRRTPVSNDQDDRILTGMIVCSSYLDAVRIIYRADLMESSFARMVASWCLAYYKEYKLAPGIHIKDLFDTEVRCNRIDHDDADMVEAFLQRISTAYEQTEAIHPDYLLAETESIFRSRSLRALHADIGLALDQEENPEEIHARILEHQQQTQTCRGRSFVSHMRTSTELLQAKIKPPLAIVWPWLREASLNMIYAERGLGKSWLGMIIAAAVTRENYQDLSIGNWYVKNPCGCLYLDGEMGEFDLQDRFKQILAPLSPESRRFPLVTFSGPDYTEAEKETINLLSPVWQDRIMKFLESRRGIRLMIVDNLACLCSGRDENDSQAISTLNTWLIQVRAIGVAVILVHHAGKSGEQRGSSALEDPLNSSILLKKPQGWTQGGGAHFNVSFTKARNDPGGDGYSPFNLRVVEHEESSQWRQWQATNMGGQLI